MRPAWVFDLDGTISNNDHRQHLMPRVNKASTWEIYSLAGDGDTPIWPIISMMNYAIDMGIEVIIVTGRNKVAERVTRDWLNNNSIPFDLLFMRHEGDYRPNVEYKLAQLDYLLADGYSRDVELWVDDFPAVVEAMKTRNIPTILVDITNG